MGNSPSAQLELELPEVVPSPPVRPRPEAAPARRTALASRPRARRLRLPVAVLVLALTALAAALLFYQVDQFLASDPRFTLRLEAGSGVRIEGAVYVAPERLRQVFARDFGRSVYLIPLEARRRELLAVDWVREARVERHWPNRVVVRIAERTPVAFVLLRAAPGGAAHTWLIDAEGEILPAPARASFTFPVLLGLSRAQPRDVRRQLVELFLRFQREAGPAGGLVSEVDLSDPGNLKITAVVEGVPVRVWVGSGNFRARLDNFLSNFPEIRRLLPEAWAFDLRLDRHITVMKGAGRAR